MSAPTQSLECVTKYIKQKQPLGEVPEGKLKVIHEVQKILKSKYRVVNADIICDS